LSPAARLLVALILAVPAASGVAEEPPDHHGSGEPHAPGGDDATVHHRFEDAERWAERFEDPARDAWQLPDSVIARVVDRPDLVVADIGSATGYFAVRFARAVPEGAVIGADVEPDMVRYLNDRARAEGIPNLVSVLAAPGDPHLPRLADVVFVCNTIHHIDDRVDYFRRLREQTAPGARLVVVDYRPESEKGPPHKLEADRVTDELERAGWSLQARHDVLPEQWFLVLGRSET
jgi:SAM-dependent methyltransferase